MLSYAQRFEDIHILRCLGERADGFYIDVGAGHPVYDNVSFYFYLQGWRGISVEPNPHLVALNRAVRPRDTVVEALASDEPGEATLYLFDHFHGLSTMLESQAAAAQKEVGQAPQPIRRAVTTLNALCAQHVKGEIDFLKIDVEGAEQAVLEGIDLVRYRPKLIVVEADSLGPTGLGWRSWESIITGNGYRYVFTEQLNRYYLADEAAALGAYFEHAPEWYENIRQIGTFGPAAEDETHPDHHLATLLAGLDLARLPLLDRRLVVERLTAGVPDHPVSEADAGAAFVRLFGEMPAPPPIVGLPTPDTVHRLYARLVDSELFRVASGRISASYAW
jgi:FkbM family methyltransferase